MRPLILFVLPALLSFACGGSPPPRDPTSPGNQACSLGMPGARATVTNTANGVVLTVMEPGHMGELRSRARDAAMVHGPNAHEGMGHDGRHNRGGHHGLRSIDLPPMRAEVTDIEGGARIELVPMDPANLDTLRAKIRERADKMNSACEMPPV